MTFSRVKALTEDVQVVANALRKSDNLLQVSDDGLLVRRTSPVDAVVDRSPYTLYIEGFATNLQLDDVMQKLQATGMPVVCVRMQYHRTKGGKDFTGSVFVELSTPEDVTKVLTSETPLEVEGTTLTVKSISQHKEDKRQKRDSKRVDSNAPDTVDTAQVETAAVEAGGAKKSLEYITAPFAEDLLVRAESLPSTCSREILQQIVERCGGTIHYIDYSRGLDHAYIQLQTESVVGAKGVCDKIVTAFIVHSTDGTKDPLAIDLLRILYPQRSAVVGTTDGDAEQEEKQETDTCQVNFPTFVAVEGSSAEEEWKRIESARNERRSAMERRRSNHHHPHNSKPKPKRSRPAAAS
uniref:Lupus La A n=1 Tax=Lygus hesperus TaxID=30085 RepID=A0A0A9YC58_LYGHE